MAAVATTDNQKPRLVTMLGQRLKTKITAQERATVGGTLRPAKAHSKTTEAMIAEKPKNTPPAMPGGGGGGMGGMGGMDF